jgi:hypothetical protein
MEPHLNERAILGVHAHGKLRLEPLTQREALVGRMEDRVNDAICRAASQSAQDPNFCGHY